MTRTVKRVVMGVLLVGVASLTTGCESCNPWWSAAGGAVIGAATAKAFGEDTKVAVIAGVAGGAIGYAICQASLNEQREAELKAERARAAMQAEELERLKRENRIVLAKVGEREYVPVDENGRASDKKIHFEKDPITEKAADPAPETDKPSAPGADPHTDVPAPPVKTAKADGLKLEGMKNDDGTDTFNVIFVDA